MDSNITTFLSYILAISGIAGFIWFLFEKTEETISTESKVRISKWLHNIKPLNIFDGWPSHFPSVFDRIFGEKHLTIRCFLKSCLASIFSVFLLILVWLLWRPDEFYFIFSKGDWMAVSVDVFSTIFSFNIIIDYISLLETRFLIGLAKKEKHNPSVIIFIDFLLTCCIAILGFILIGFVVVIVALHNYGIAISDIPFANLYDAFRPLAISTLTLSIYSDASAISSGVYFFSTFLTSVWLWLYVVSGKLLQLMSSFDNAFNRLKRLLDIDNKPLRSMGYVSMFISIILFTFSLLIF